MHSLDIAAPIIPTKRAAVKAAFEDRPNTWIDSDELMRIGGKNAWRTRVSECRRELGMQIDNRVRRIPDSDALVSEYRYVPEPQPSPAQNSPWTPDSSVSASI